MMGKDNKVAGIGDLEAFKKDLQEQCEKYLEIIKYSPDEVLMFIYSGVKTELEKRNLI